MSKEKTNKTYLAPAEIKKFKMTLLAKRTEILSNVTCMEDETLRKPKTDSSNMPIHMADAGTDNYEMENTLGLMDSERKLIVEIDHALSRIEDGTYGICEGSDEPIPKERLKAIPWARYCVAYASLLEKGLVKKEEAFDEPYYEDEANEEQNEDLDNPAGERKSYE
jgi:RNA polymerase-binding protein DksA